ncbi:PIN domain-containing protein [Candidatus Collierbacteria bacterium]|nr:PIN domain-containing protein [Candidatus Collierbacteria bacterium]
MVLIDTNIFLRIFVKENERMFRECGEILKLATRGAIAAYTNTIVLTEIQFVLTTIYHYPRDRIKEALESVLSVPGLKITDDTDARLATDAYGKTNIKFADCLLASSKLIQEKKAAIVSYDRDFDKLGVRRLEPKDVVK